MFKFSWPKWMLELIPYYSRDPEVRRKAWFTYLAKKCRENNLHIYLSHLAWQTDAEFVEATRAWGTIPGLPPDRRFFVQNAAAASRNVPGDTAECGVRFGTSSHFALRGIADPAKLHHIFDSFDGLSEPTAEDTPVKSFGFRWKKHDMKAGEEQTRKHLAAYPNCRFYRGWIPERFDEIRERRFSFVHIDVDLYAPTLDGLKFFYPRMNPGGVLLCDDYGFLSCPGARRAMDEFFADKPERVFHIPTGQGLVIKSPAVVAQRAAA